MTNYNDLCKKAHDLAHNKMKFNSLAGCFVFDYAKLTDSDIEDLVADYMIYDRMMSCESTGSDNVRFDTHMMPALLKIIRNADDKSNQYDFITSYRAAVIEYFREAVLALLVAAIERINQEEGYVRHDIHG